MEPYYSTSTTESTTTTIQYYSTSTTQPTATIYCTNTTATVRSTVSFRLFLTKHENIEDKFELQ